MKKLVTLAFYLFFTMTALADVGPVGRSFWQNLDGTAVSGSVEKWFINCKNTSGGSVNDGTLMIADVANDDGYSCTTTSTAKEVPLCVIQKQDGSACADDQVCRCQTYGLSDDVLFDSTNSAATAGDMAFISENNAGYVQAEASGSIDADDYPVGVFYDSPSASADAEIFLRLR